MGGKQSGRPKELTVKSSYLISPSLSPSYATDDDIVFEDFARLRLKGMKDDDCDEQFC